jgi:hypothetical protein
MLQLMRNWGTARGMLARAISDVSPKVETLSKQIHFAVR